MKAFVRSPLCAVLAGVALLTLMSLPGGAQAQAYPAKPIRLVVPFPAGGATDLLARAMSQRLAQSLGQQVVVDNRAGAGGSLGSGEVARAAPDGYTILLATSSTHAIGPNLNPNLPYKVDADFTPIAHVANAGNLLLVPNSLPVKSVAELISHAKANPGKLNYASSGNGTIVHLSTEAFKSQAGIFVTHIPYRGTALAIPDLVVGNVHLLIDSIVSGLPHVKDGKLKALAYTGLKRSALLPDLPTVAESGLPGYQSVTWFGVYAPKGLPAALVTRLNSELMSAMQAPEVRERLAKLGAEPVTSGTPAQFEAMVKADSARWATLIRERKIGAE
ncbi:Bug family tripartite tricarboxylate transporter substrate binding protein [Roseateles toxinivorans]|uniref:Tripartite-type tricarboxylate transporter receptor subunit TctC n=1 Tax=Roseateles toxinivorans TaxID=270368 RepID=A0A4R6QS18_9BURK|nr:tripartite tricarboxylate transporter substrate binding protein [Roseateles toxinivorans]TDP73956.1 tripartite-type tricarboxylate transporter receptor subunit TctC [Roseateles toxinivorans]